MYTFDDRDAEKQERARELLRTAFETRHGGISFQVVQEFLNVAQHEFEAPMSAADATLFLRDVLAPLCFVHSSIAIAETALDLRDRWQLHFSDALIVAGALEAGCTTLYSEDFQDGLKIRDLTVENPFRD